MENRNMNDKNIFVTQSSMPPYEEYIEAIKPLWESHRLTNMGTYHKELELRLKEYLDVPYVSLIVNGHMALEMTIQAMDFPEGSEVITTPFTFISTTHAIVRNRLKPIFCDIKMEDYTIDETKIEELITEKTVAILPVHVYGNICNVETIQEIADKYGLKVIYDACHAFAESYNGIQVGNFGDASVFSFHATKVYNTIEGGAVTFESKSLYEKLYNLKNFGIRGEELVVAVGANAKMNEFAAIMGLCNLRQVSANIVKRRECAEYYIELFDSCEQISLPTYNQASVSYNYGYFPVRFKSIVLRDRVYGELRKEEIYARKYFYPLTSDAACFKNQYRNLELRNAREASDTILVLPIYPDLEKKEIERIAAIVQKWC